MSNAHIPSDAEIEALRRTSSEENAREARAEGLRFLADEKAIELSLVGRGGAPGSRIIIPIAVEPQLAALPAEQLAELEVYPGGTTIACEAADLHLSVEALVMKALMGPDYIQQIRSISAAALGRTTSDAKAAAARENGKKGGRPRIQTTKVYGEGSGLDPAQAPESREYKRVRPVTAPSAGAPGPGAPAEIEMIFNGEAVPCLHFGDGKWTFIGDMQVGRLERGKAVCYRMGGRIDPPLLDVYGTTRSPAQLYDAMLRACIIGWADPPADQGDEGILCRFE